MLASALAWLLDHGPLVGTALYFVWTHVAGTKAAAVATRVKEAATLAWHSVQLLIAAGVVDPNELEARALAKATDALTALGIPVTPALAALLKHELDLAAAAVAQVHLAATLKAQAEVTARAQAQVDQLDQGVQGVVNEWAAAEARGKATGAAIHENVETTLIPPDELPTVSAPP